MIQVLHDRKNSVQYYMIVWGDIRLIPERSQYMYIHYLLIPLQLTFP